MAKINPDSRASQARTAETVLRGLLRTPKTRNGLVAAVTSRMISRRFVFGWLANQVVSGGIVKLKSGDIVTYQVKGRTIQEKPTLSAYPSWLDPRFVPAVIERKVFIDGKQIDPDQLIQPRKPTK